jgi:hypothetical protein
MSPAIEKILAEINSLTPAEQRELLEFLGQDQTSSLLAAAQLVNEIKGKYSFVATSSEDFAARKQREINLEDKHNGKRRCTSSTPVRLSRTCEESSEQIPSQRYSLIRPTYAWRTL